MGQGVGVFLVLQIAAGVVLGFFVLRHWDALWRATVKLAKVVAVLGCVVTLIVGFVWLVSNHRQEAINLGCVCLGLVVITVIVKYSARGLGHVYVKSLPYLRRSPRAQRFVWLLGASREWVNSPRTDKKFVDAVGDRLFVSIPKRLFFSFGAMFIVAGAIILTAQHFNALPSHPPNLVYNWEIIWGCCFLFVVGLVVWCSLAKPVSPTTNEAVKQ
jgi:hypothetical protein